jgi:hypothetical protein
LTGSTRIQIDPSCFWRQLNSPAKTNQNKEHKLMICCLDCPVPKLPQQRRPRGRPAILNCGHRLQQPGAAASTSAPGRQLDQAVASSSPMTIVIILNVFIVSRPFIADIARKTAAQSPSLNWTWSEWRALSLRRQQRPAET